MAFACNKKLTLSTVTALYKRVTFVSVGKLKPRDSELPEVIFFPTSNSTVKVLVLGVNIALASKLPGAAPALDSRYLC